MKISNLFTAVALLSASAMAQMPTALLDNDATANTAHWKAAAPVMQSGLECRQRINPATPALRPLFPRNDVGQWELVPPKGFTVFGLPVQSITIFIDPDGELGASYTATVAAPKNVAVKAAQLGKQRKTGIGSLMAEQGARPSLTNITCTVNGSRDPE